MTGATKLLTSGGGGVVLTPATNIGSDVTVNIPATNDTLVNLASAQTLTNKTLGSGLVAGASLITSGTAVASTSGTAIDFTGIPSWVKRITVMFNGVSTSGSSLVQIQLGDSGGIEATGYLGSVDTTINGVAAALFTTGLAVNRSGAASSTNVFNGQAIFSLIGSNTWAGSLLMANSVAAGVSISACSKALSDTLTQVRITTVNGTDTFDAGSINIMYE